MKSSFMEEYRAKHRHPLNRLTHYIGIPMIVASLPWFFWNWKIALALFIIGWIFQFVGHAIEGNQPAFFRNPIYLLVGPLFVIKKLFSIFDPARRDRSSPTPPRGTR